MTLTATKPLTGTERLEASLKIAVLNGGSTVQFKVGRWSGSSPSVVGALRRRGYLVKSDMDGGFVLHEKS